MLVTLSVEIPNLGNRIKQIREEKKMTPTQLAALAGMSTANLYRIESETTKSVPRETLKAISEALEIDLDQDVKTALLKEAG
ncbi:MAG: helix-turn-helix transcriptional regulator [Xenococcaceae cyanobacterium MO_167.B27]|nr:helix-turn-helix transcriptional regulator [Xenococcaceae cyanobacterium MO_167.B27]